MNYESIFAFTIAVTIFAILPGPAIFACIAEGLTFGMRTSFGLIFGIILGDIVFLLIAIYGLSTVVQNDKFFSALEILGGLYLIWLGWRMWTKTPQTISTIEKCHKGRSWQGFLAGFVLTISNPKVIVFYMSFLPAFIDLNKLNQTDVLIVVSIITVVLLVVNIFYTWSAAGARKLFSNPSAVSKLNRAAATLMAGVGVVLLVR